jgi:hypothetical protein
VRPGPRGFLLAAALASTSGAALVACIDLFHSTDFATACDVDAAACVNANAASLAPFPADFCAWSTDVARANASHACAWLGACASPIGDDAFGDCVVRARLAYDCAANPNRRLRAGAAHDVWDHLWRASSCADVLGALFPPRTVASCAASSSAYAACAGETTLVSCAVDDAGSTITAGVESCAARAQTCVVANGGAVCAGSPSPCAVEAGTSCTTSTQLQDCETGDAGAIDLGVDCTSVGAGACVAGAPAACAATGDAGCAPSTTVTCDSNGVATACPSGVVEAVDCRALLGAASCDPTGEGRAWDVARACTAGTCASDSCQGTMLASCGRGVTFRIDCATVGLGACRLGALSGRAACAP